MTTAAVKCLSTVVQRLVTDAAWSRGRWGCEPVMSVLETWNIMVHEAGLKRAAVWGGDTEIEDQALAIETYKHNDFRRVFLGRCRFPTEGGRGSSLQLR